MHNPKACWFCQKEDDSLTFDIEFDTPVHVDCINKALQENPDHPEAIHMAYLLTDEQRDRLPISPHVCGMCLNKICTCDDYFDESLYDKF